jgi:hypothetical protein
MRYEYLGFDARAKTEMRRPSMAGKLHVVSAADRPPRRPGSPVKVSDAFAGSRRAADGALFDEVDGLALSPSQAARRTANTAMTSRVSGRPVEVLMPVPTPRRGLWFHRGLARASYHR